jgi:hypothetical protein
MSYGLAIKNSQGLKVSTGIENMCLIGYHDWANPPQGSYYAWSWANTYPHLILPCPTFFYHSISWINPCVLQYSQQGIALFNRLWVGGTVSIFFALCGAMKSVRSIDLEKKYGILIKGPDGCAMASETEPTMTRLFTISKVQPAVSKVGPFTGFIEGFINGLYYADYITDADLRYVPYVHVEPLRFLDIISTISGVDYRVRAALIYRNDSVQLQWGIYAAIDENWTLNVTEGAHDFFHLKGLPGQAGGDYIIT